MSNPNLVQTSLLQFMNPPQASIPVNIHPMVEEQVIIITKIKEQVQQLNVEEGAKNLFISFIAAIEQTWKVLELVERNKSTDIQQLQGKVGELEQQQVKQTKEIQELFENLGMILRENQDEQEEEGQVVEEQPAQQLAREGSKEVLAVVAEIAKMDSQRLKENFDEFCHKYRERISIEVLEGVITNEYVGCLATCSRQQIVIYDANEKRYLNFGLNYEDKIIYLYRKNGLYSELKKRNELRRANNNNARNLPRRNNYNYNRQELAGQRRNPIGNQRIYGESQYFNNNIQNRRRYPNGQNQREQGVSINNNIQNRRSYDNGQNGWDQHGFFNNNVQSRRRYNNRFNGWEQGGYYQPRKQSYNQFMNENQERRAGENYPRIYPMNLGFSQRAG